MSSFITHAQNRDAIAFKAQVEETLAGKVVLVLEGLKAIVASSMFEEGGVSGGVSSVKKKPAPPAAGTVTLPGSKEEKSKEGGLVHAGRSNSSDGEKTGEFVLPGQKKTNEELIDEGVRDYSVHKTGSHDVEHKDSSVKQTQFEIHHKGKKVGELEHEDYFGTVHGHLHGKDLPDISEYGRHNHEESGVLGHLHSFLRSKTGAKWSSNLHKNINTQSEKIMAKMRKQTGGLVGKSKKPTLSRQKNEETELEEAKNSNVDYDSKKMKKDSNRYAKILGKTPKEMYGVKKPVLPAKK